MFGVLIKKISIYWPCYYVFWNSNDFLETVTRLTKNYLSPFQFRLGNKSFIVISEPNDAKVRLFTIIL
ncbi:hypothetical protein PUN28_003754 [Cardiocondyla obscurior]|uniref:Uncharacterized protein n=1 Tax=Cardiocondyla obscurior TaxID=286306 RepID=A0AAW2GN50_9HYME